MSKIAQETARLVKEMRSKRGGSLRDVDHGVYEISDVVAERGAGYEKRDSVYPASTSKHVTKVKRKPIRASKEKVKKRKAEVPVILSVREEVFRLDKACICGSCPPSDKDEMHEIKPRSATRGMAPEERFSVENCVRLSHGCHQKVTGELHHGKRLKIIAVDDKLGAMGQLMLQCKDGRVVFYARECSISEEQ